MRRADVSHRQSRPRSRAHAGNRSRSPRMVALHARLRMLQALVLDCDGVLTPGDLIYDEHGTRLLRFSSKDGFALAALCRSGFPVGVLSGRPTDVAEQRLRELGIAQFAGNCRNKGQGMSDMCAAMGVRPELCAYVGDDLPDLAAFARAGLRIAVADAALELKRDADVITEAHGGRGAVREVCEAILKARGDWPALLARMRGG